MFWFLKQQLHGGCAESLRRQRIGILIFPKYLEILKLQSCISVSRLAQFQGLLCKYMQDKEFPGRMSARILSLHSYLIYNRAEKNGFLFQGAHITPSLALRTGVTGAIYVNNHCNHPPLTRNQGRTLQRQKLLSHRVNHHSPKWCQSDWLLLTKFRGHCRSNIVIQRDLSSPAWATTVPVPTLPVTCHVPWIRNFPLTEPQVHHL